DGIRDFHVTGVQTCALPIFEMYYSFDEGDTYHELSMVNQFGNLAANGKNSFTYNLEELELSGEELWIRISPKAGDRTGGGAYNESTGTLRIDNLHLVGIAPTSNEGFVINKLHYFLFHKTNGTIFRAILMILAI